MPRQKISLTHSHTYVHCRGIDASLRKILKNPLNRLRFEIGFTSRVLPFSPPLARRVGRGARVRYSRISQERFVVAVFKSVRVAARKRDASACRLARSCDLRRPCAGGRAARRPSSSFLRRTYARPRAPSALLASPPVTTQTPARSPPRSLFFSSPITVTLPFVRKREAKRQCVATLVDPKKCTWVVSHACASRFKPANNPLEGGIGERKVAVGTTRSPPRFLLACPPPCHRVYLRNRFKGPRRQRSSKLFELTGWNFFYRFVWTFDEYSVINKWNTFARFRIVTMEIVSLNWSFLCDNCQSITLLVMEYNFTSSGVYCNYLTICGKLFVKKL